MTDYYYLNNIHFSNDISWGNTDVVELKMPTIFGDRIKNLVTNFDYLTLLLRWSRKRVAIKMVDTWENKFAFHYLDNAMR